MQYKSVFLTNVILRVDFVSQVQSLKTALEAAVKNTCVKFFPIPEDRKVETQQVFVTNQPGTQNTILSKEEFFEWHFFGIDKEKELCITNACMFISVKQYTTYENLKGEFFKILEVLLATYPDIKINRIGLRYVNQIELPPEKKKRKSWYHFWNKYINDSLIRGLTFADADNAVSRHMNSIEMNYSNHMLRFQYGVFNSDYPAPNKKNSFILDTDIYATGLIELEDVKSYSDDFHRQAIDWFERSIKAALRDKMEVMTDAE